VLGINLNDFSDENDGFKRCHATLLLEKEERVHKWPNHVWNCLWVELCNLIDALNQKVPILIGA